MSLDRFFVSGTLSVPVFYDPRQSTTQNESFSPSAQKPALVVADWLAAGLPLELHGFQPLTPAEISLAHDPGFVQGVLDCKIPNGFGNYLPEVAAALPWTTGSMYAAAALKSWRPLPDSRVTPS